MIYIGIPTYDGRIEHTTMGGLFNVAYASGKDRVPICLDVIPHDPFIGHARDLMAHRFLSIPDATDMVMIDADVGFSADDFRLLLKVDADIVCGIYPYKEDDERYPVAPIMPYIKKGRLVECMFAPTGFMRIRRKVMEKIRENVTTYSDTEHGILHQFFPFGKQGPSFKSEDVQFCMLAREAGFTVYGLEGLELTHTGKKTYSGKWEAEKRGTTYTLKAA